MADRLIASRVVTLALAIACGASAREVSAEGRQRYGGAITVTWSGATSQIESFVLDPVMRVALSIEPVAGQPLRARVRLRKTLRFHDGRALSSADVVTTIQSALTSSNAWMLAPITRVRALSAEWVELELATAASVQTLREALATPAAYLRHAGGGAVGLVGTGPFRVESSTTQEIKLIANGEYFAGRPYLDVVIFRRFTSDADERASFELGSLDVASAVRVGLSAKRRAGAVELDAKPTEIVALIPHGKLATPSIVEGLGAAIDRERLRRLAIAAPSTSFSGRVDAASARGKIPAGTAARLAFDRDAPGMRVAAERILADLGAVGVSIALEPLSPAELDARVASRACDLCLAVVAPPLPGKAWHDATLRGPLSRAIPLALRGRRYVAQGALVGLSVDAVGRLSLDGASLESR